MANFAPFDAADYLDSEETIAEYLTAALEDPIPMFSSPRSAMWLERAAWRSLPKMRASDVKASTRRSHPAPSRAMTPCSRSFTHWVSKFLPVLFIHDEAE